MGNSFANREFTEIHTEYAEAAFTEASEGFGDVLGGDFAGEDEAGAAVGGVLDDANRSGQEREAVIAQAEDFRSAARAVVVADHDGFAFTEMVAAAVAAELRHLVVELQQRAGGDQALRALAEGVVSIVVADVR